MHHAAALPLLLAAVTAALLCGSCRARDEPLPHNWPLYEARVNVTVLQPLQPDGALYGISKGCFGCDAQFLCNLSAPGVTTLQIDANHPFTFELVDNFTVLQRFTRTMGGHGVYTLLVTGDAYVWSTHSEPSDYKTPAFVACAVLVALALLYALGRVLAGWLQQHRANRLRAALRRSNRSVNAVDVESAPLLSGRDESALPGAATFGGVTDQPQNGAVPHAALLDAGQSKRAGDQALVDKKGALSSAARKPSVPLSGHALSTKPQTSGRLHSLDTFRGISICIMIVRAFVNYGAGGYSLFQHSTWNGLTIADTVFPWFMFMMGVAMPLSFRSLQRRNTPLHWVLWKIVKRSVILFWFGMFLAGGYYVTVTGVWRVPGVLQRFAVAYFVVSLLIVFVPKIRVPDDAGDEDDVVDDDRRANSYREYLGVRGPVSRAWFVDVYPFIFEWTIIIMFIIVWLLITFLLNVPHCGRGYLGPGGLADHGDYMNCTGGAAGYIDRKILGVKRIYQHPTCHGMYHTGPYDPEGILGNLTSIFLCFCGVQSGRIILSYRNHLPRLKRWLIWGVVLGAVGTALAGASRNNGVIPINKNLWSLSFVLTMGGTANIFLSLLYVIIDVFPLWGGEPFVWAGMNSLVIYICSEIVSIGGTGSNQYPPLFPFFWDAGETYASQLAMNMTGVAVWVFVAWWMFMHDFYINV